MYEMDQYTVSLLHFDDGIKDESGKVWTANGGAAVSTAQSKFGGSSMYFNGTNEYITTPKTSDFEFGSGDFTIDFWLYLTASAPSDCLICGATRQGVYEGADPYAVGTAFYGQVTTNGTSWIKVGKSGLTINSWNHVALIRYGSNLYAAVNGTLSTAVAISGAITTSGASTFALGNYSGGGIGSFPGYIDEFRVSKGIARWTSNFTPPTVPYSPGTTVNAPTNLTATAGDSQVALTWTAVTGSTGYNVKRATTAGGLYTTVGANISTNSYVDTAVTNGTTYYYVVTTVDADGESANSNEASATPVASSKALLRVAMNDSSEREYQLSESEIDGFINWVKGHVSTDSNCYMLNKIEVLQNSKDYLMFEKIISFEVMPLTK